MSAQQAGGAGPDPLETEQLLARVMATVRETPQQRSARPWRALAGVGGLAAVVLAAAAVAGLFAFRAPSPQPVASAPVASQPAAVAPSSPAATATPAPSIRPDIVCDTAAGSVWQKGDAHGSLVPMVLPIDCKAAVAVAEAVVGEVPAVDSIEYGLGTWCPPGANCPAVIPTMGHVIFHRCSDGSCDLPDLLVGVRAQNDGSVTALAAQAMPGPKLVCEPPPLYATPLQCRRAIEAALAISTSWREVARIEFAYGKAVPCPVGMACELIPNTMGWVRFYGPTSSPLSLLADYVVNSDANGNVTAWLVPPPSPSSSPGG
jgi:hypothetical protein